MLTLVVARLGLTEDGIPVLDIVEIEIPEELLAALADANADEQFEPAESGWGKGPSAKSLYGDQTLYDQE